MEIVKIQVNYKMEYLEKSFTGTNLRRQEFSESS